MAGEDVPDAVRLAQGFVYGQIVCARNAEHGVDLVRFQRTNDSFTTGYAHCLSFPGCADVN